jgi:hypothetical protein
MRDRYLVALCAWHRVFDGGETEKVGATQRAARPIVVLPNLAACVHLSVHLPPVPLPPIPIRGF